MNGDDDDAYTSNLVILPTFPHASAPPLPPKLTHYVVAFRKKGSWSKWNIALDCVSVQEAKNKAELIRKDPNNWEVEVWLVHPVF